MFKRRTDSPSLQVPIIGIGKRLDRIESILASIAGFTPVVPAPMQEADNLRVQCQRYKTALIECAREAGVSSPTDLSKVEWQPGSEPVERWAVERVRNLRAKFELATGGRR
jgi:hypothetical protein